MRPMTSRALRARACQATKGVRAGAVVDLDNLERSIRLAVEQAERAADLRITDVVLGVSGPDLRSDIVRAKLPHGRARSDGASMCATCAWRRLKGSSRRAAKCCIRRRWAFTVDGTAGIKDPRGMFAETLTASFLVVSAPTAGLRNIVQCVSRARISTCPPSWLRPMRPALPVSSRTRRSRGRWSSISGRRGDFLCGSLL